MAQVQPKSNNDIRRVQNRDKITNLPHFFRIIGKLHFMQNLQHIDLQILFGTFSTFVTPY